MQEKTGQLSNAATTLERGMDADSLTILYVPINMFDVDIKARSIKVCTHLNKIH